VHSLAPVRSSRHKDRCNRRESSTTVRGKCAIAAINSNASSSCASSFPAARSTIGTMEKRSLSRSNSESSFQNLVASCQAHRAAASPQPHGVKSFSPPLGSPTSWEPQCLEKGNALTAFYAKWLHMQHMANWQTSNDISNCPPPPGSSLPMAEGSSLPMQDDAFMRLDPFGR